MGAHSTVRITESKARQEILRHVYSCPKEELEAMLDAILDKRLYNCHIVPDDYDDNHNNIFD